MNKRFFPPKRDFSSLSLKDLLEARDAYHVHLAHLDNVIATAVGRYRIRDEDPDAKEAKGPKEWRSRKHAPERTLGNTVVKKWSWPALLVFVKEWLPVEELAKQDPDQVVPRFLYLSDGRVVPTCVILAERQEVSPPPLQNITFPEHLIGGGYPLFTEKQGQQHIGSIGCLVTDGDLVYALTNRHVTGEENQEVFSFLGGKKLRIGVSSKSRLDQRSALGKRLFKDVYRGWPGERSYVNIDAGLIRVDDIEYWTSQVFGVGEMGDLVDLNTNTLSLDLIGCPVRAFGAASGEMVGEISALFYRYKFLGGFEYISDLLIGPRTQSSGEFWEIDGDEREGAAIQPADASAMGAKGTMKTRPGDSGTVWFFDQNLSMAEARAKGLAGERARRLRPLALQWGGQTILDGTGESKAEFALATCLSTICRELDLELVPDFDIGHSEYWGKTGHYKIAAKACELVTDPKLKKLLMANVNNIAFNDQTIQEGGLKKVNPVSPSKPHQPFVPLADVPDLVWRASRKLDDSNHFADMDQEGTGDFKGKTLLDLCKKPENVDIDVWNAFYDSLSLGRKRGALPFRVWQIYNLMVEFVHAGKVAEFICAGGIVSHYVGDACQPLHVSFLHHGRPGHEKTEEKVHSVYETQMLDRKATDVIAGINATLAGKKAKADVTGGHAAAVSVVELMRQTVKTLAPIKVIEAFNSAQPNKRIADMWDVLGTKTITCMAGGCLRMASLWASAWHQGGGSKITNKKLGEVGRDELINLYNDKQFLPAFRLQDAELAAALK